MPTYPTGPTSCTADPTCSPKIATPGSSAPVVFYSFWACAACTMLLFWIYKKLWVARRHRETGALRTSLATTSAENNGEVELNDITISPKTEDSGVARLTSDGTNSEMADVTLLGYKENSFGSICAGVVYLVSAVWLVIFLLIMVDQYNDCQLESIDNLCFYGDYPLFGSYDTNSEYMFTVWILCIPWYVFMVEKGIYLRNWFRMPVELDDADLVLVSASMSAERMVVNAGSILTLWLKFRKKFASALVHAQTVPVITTPEGIKYIEFECKRFVLLNGQFMLPTVTVGPTLNEIHDEGVTGLDAEEATRRTCTLGPNKIAFQVSPILTLISEEIFSYFYLYQLIMYVVWFWFSYLVVAMVLCLVVCLSATANIYIKRSHQETIASMTKHHIPVQVLRNKAWTEIDSFELVPGDTVRVRSGEIAPCDMVLIHGSAVCDESGLTGESMPVGKTVLLKNDKVYSVSANKSSTLFGGTTILQAGSEEEAGDDALPIAVVTATGINANKGQLISTILHPTPMTFKYDEELPLVVSMLLVYAAVCFILSIYFQSNSGASSTWTTKWAYGVFTVSQIVSPLLPIALVVGQTMASQRLKALGVFCLDPKRIAISGKIRVFAFDKTGTITKEGLDFLGVQECSQGTVLNTDGKEVTNYTFKETQFAEEDPMEIGLELEGALATCHNLKTLKDALVGNQVEMKMFSCMQDVFGYSMVQDKSGATRTVARALAETDPDSDKPRVSHKLEIVKTFEFDHARMTMTVVVRDTVTSKTSVYCKGSPERIGELCGASNSLPVDYDHVQKAHATAGCYVLGMAVRHLGQLSPDEVEGMTRDAAELEGPLTLIGLVLFRNELKPDSAEAMIELKAGDVRPIMLTGDNAQCGCYIARKVGMVEEDKLVLFGDDPHNTGVVTWSVMGGGSATASVLQVEKYKEMIEELCNSSGGGEHVFDRVELAMTQKALDALTATGAIEHLLIHTRIFARLRPDGKVAVVDMLAARGIVVGMCGDGGNDCGALRAAHAGMALSEAEASVVSPFTSKTKSITSVVDLLKEGRSALATSFASYKFLITYGQLFSVLKLVCFYYGVIMCMMDYLMIDGLAVLVVSYVMTLSKPEDKLPNQRPTSSLLGVTSMASVCGMQVLNLVFLCGALGLMKDDSDYQKWPADSVESTGSWWLLGDNWETTVIFTTVYSQFLWSGVIFTLGSHWRKPVYHNWMLLVFWAVVFAGTCSVLLADANSFSDVFHSATSAFGPGTRFESPVWTRAGKVSKAMPTSLRWRLFALIMSCLVCSGLWEKVVVLGHVRDYAKRKYQKSLPELRL
eukprot:TRINITY_DN14834_c0_g1_i2.p1 TRINITY_DN14834_c0_g1~~TRINITY_DN14834_c0_g1_i2.p1  ORF type:complete len:1308 (+),score=380.72 TRINITY_DN14834_c0_g1_i2:208-4131(+)